MNGRIPTAPPTTQSDTQAGVPTEREIRAETSAARKAILDAMVRLVEGRPVHVPRGQVSVSALAREADIDRAKFTTGRYRDLGERFKGILSSLNEAQTPREIELEQKLARLQETVAEQKKVHAALQQRCDRWENSTRALAQQVQVLILENRNLEQRLQIAEQRLGHAHALSTATSPRPRSVGVQGDCVHATEGRSPGPRGQSGS